MQLSSEGCMITDSMDQGLWINGSNVDLVNQTLVTLTEYCQGPCKDNQLRLVNHECNGIDLIAALILNDIETLTSSDQFYALKINASKLILALMESNQDKACAQRILRSLKPKGGV